MPSVSRSPLGFSESIERDQYNVYSRPCCHALNQNTKPVAVVSGFVCARSGSLAEAVDVCKLVLK
eukprot:SAG11_NODE_13793_length_639_cov_0.859259_1_plen_64_part_01